jgi:hypothetical protein
LSELANSDLKPVRDAVRTVPGLGKLLTRLLKKLPKESEAHEAVTQLKGILK